MRRPHFCQTFHYFVNDRLRVYLHPCLSREHLDGTVQSPTALMATPVDVPSSRHTRVYHSTVKTRESESLPAYFKEFLDQSRLQRLKSYIRGSRAYRAARADYQLREAGFLAPELLAYGCRRSGSVRPTRFTLTRGFDDYLNLDQVAASWPDLPRRVRHRILIHLGREIGNLHKAGFSHGDLRPGNVLLRIEEGGTVFVAFLDNERTRRYRRLASSLRLKNLVQLNMLLSKNLGHRERLVFFLQYCRTAGITKHRKLLGRIRRKTRLRLRDLVARGKISRDTLPPL